MTPTLDRFTTEFVESEDRIRILGQSAEGGEPIVIWFTQRLLKRVLPILLEWLTKRTGGNTLRGEAMQSFAQLAAKSSLPQQEPVRVGHEYVGWLANVAEMTPRGQEIRLLLRGAEDAAAVIDFTELLLRQWLGALHEICLRSEWALDVWPSWLEETPPPEKNTGVVLH